MCPVCATCLEMEIHALRDCTFASNIWQIVVSSQVQNTFFSLSLHYWLVWNLHDKDNLNRDDMEWRTLFIV